MTIARPTRSELVTRLQSAIESRLSAEQLRHSDAKVYARAFAGTADAIYSLVSYMHRQQFVFSCDAEYLDRHGSLYGMYRKAATKAQVTVRFDVSSGGSVPAGTVIQTESGMRFVTVSDSDESGLSKAEAEEAGVNGNLAQGTVVTLLSPIEGVKSEASFSINAYGGADVESDANFRSRVLLKMRETPMGGAASDYKIWARQVAGVTRAWCYPEENGAGTVTVRFVCDDLENSIPTQEMVDKVKGHIEEVRPVCAKVTVTAPVAYPVNIRITDLTPDSELVRAQVEAELRALFRREAEPGVRLFISHIRAAISGAAGETDYVLAEPAADVNPGAGKIPVLGEISWP